MDLHAAYQQFKEAAIKNNQPVPSYQEWLKMNGYNTSDKVSTTVGVRG